MKTVGFWGISTEDIAALRSALPTSLQEGYRFAQLPAAVDLLAVEQFALLAVAPGAEPESGVPIPPSRLLLLPGSDLSLLQRCKAACVMSYGGSSKDSLTLSSLEGRQLSLAIQRELPTLSGGSVERQELMFPLRGEEGPLDLLFRVGLLLVLGVCVEDLDALLQTRAF